MTQIISITDAEPGMMILRVTAQNGPVKIRKSGLITSPAMIQGLIEMGVQEVEVDPEQTVEICDDKPQTGHSTAATPTQALLRGAFDTRARQTDNAISEQFNRSLFLPTVNGLPGWWKLSVRPALSGLVLIIGGLAIGYSLAKLPAMLALIFAEPPETVFQAPVVTVPAVSESQKNKPESSALESNDEDTPDTQQVKSVPLVEATSAETVVNETPVEVQSEKVEVSPDLMARFNKVMSDLENEEARGEDIIDEAVVNVYDDVQRVDQLPARLLTRLPTMDFSAHMYASLPRDRWVRVNGLDKVEGDWIDGKVQIVNIEAQRVILQFEGEVFAMTALTDW